MKTLENWYLLSQMIISHALLCKNSWCFNCICFLIDICSHKWYALGWGLLSWWHSYCCWYQCKFCRCAHSNAMVQSGFNIFLCISSGILNVFDFAVIYLKPFLNFSFCPHFYSRSVVWLWRGKRDPAPHSSWFWTGKEICDCRRLRFRQQSLHPSAKRMCFSIMLSQWKSFVFHHQTMRRNHCFAPGRSGREGYFWPFDQ